MADAPRKVVLEDDPLELISRLAAQNYHHKPSMLQDVLARRPTEIDALNGGIVREGASRGIATPLHSVITSLIAGVQASWKEAR